MRLDDQGWAGVTGLRQPPFEPLQVMRQSRADIGVDDRRRDPLELLDLWQYLRGQRHIDSGQTPFQGLSSGALVGRVAPGVQIAYRHRLDPFALQRRDRAVERGRVERRFDAAVGADSLAHAEPQMAGHELLGRRQAQIVAVVLQPLAHLDHVAMALGRQQPDPGPPVLDQSVGRDRRAVDDTLGL